MKTGELLMIGGGVAALALGLWVWKKGGVAGAASAAVGAVGDAAVGTVLGVGDFVGIPRTDQTECQRAIAEGRTWDSSFACPAGTFLGSLWDKATGNGPQTSGFGAGQSDAETQRLIRWNSAGQYAGSGSGGVDPGDIFSSYTDPMGGFYP